MGLIKIGYQNNVHLIHPKKKKKYAYQRLSYKSWYLSNSSKKQFSFPESTNFLETCEFKVTKTKENIEELGRNLSTYILECLLALCIFS